MNQNTDSHRVRSFCLSGEEAPATKNQEVAWLDEAGALVAPASTDQRASEGDREDVVLLVDDEPGVLQALSRNLRRQPYRLYTVRSAAEAVDVIKSRPVDLVVTDEAMPGMRGTEFLGWVASEYPEIVRIMLTGKPSVEAMMQAVNHGEVYRFLTKPCEVVSLAMTIRTGLEHKRLVTQNRELLDLTQRQLAELERSNRQLEQFAMVVSHDIRAPLQTIRSYCELVQDVAGEHLSAEAANFLEEAVGGADRMGRLVEDILEYSRIRRTPQRLESVDLGQAANTAVEDISSLLREKNGRVIVAKTLPTVLGCKARLQQLFQNLLGNALKFCTDRSPRVLVTAENLAGEWRICVEDNGVGIAPEEQVNVFEAFCRGAKSHAVEGSGLGLATCKQIVQQHGGRIWLQSEPGEGTRIYFTLSGCTSGSNCHGTADP